MSEQASGHTCEEICTCISKWASEVYGVNVKPRQIYMYHPRGELWPMFELLEMAKADGYFPVSAEKLPTQQTPEEKD